jgi:hypothetical protein
MFSVECCPETGTVGHFRPEYLEGYLLAVDLAEREGEISGNIMIKDNLDF